METQLASGPALAAAITKIGSKQTYDTVRFLVDTGRVEAAYQAYAYFRWVDDWLDQEPHPRTERLAFVKRQQAVVDSCTRGELLADLTPEERFVADLLWQDTAKNSGLHAYIRNMMAVMAFDADRRGRLISGRELNDYSHSLAVAVTEALHYFIGHSCASPHGDIRYMAVTGAHITHMLRDTLEDAAAGYYNIPCEVLAANGIAPWEVESSAYRAWVQARVSAARACFRAGRAYLAQVDNLRCRIAGYAYIHRFEAVLDAIEREGYVLRAQYHEHGSRGQAAMIGWALLMALRYRRPGHGVPAPDGRVKL